MSADIETSDFWGVYASGSSDEVFIMPGIKQNKKAAFLVADDGINAEKEFNGIFTIRKGNSFEVLEFARGIEDNGSYRVTKSGIVQLPF
jgi:hypothetical protein